MRRSTGRDFRAGVAFAIAGLTDYQIAVRRSRCSASSRRGDCCSRMVRALRGAAAHEPAAKQGHVLPNVREILEHLRGRADVRSYLLTGNTRGGAKAKLTHYGLFDFFPDGAFAEDTGERATIAARALELARQAGPVADDGVFVIGDTPHDIECANAIGARTIAVATGGYSRRGAAGAPPVAAVRRAAAGRRVPAARSTSTAPPTLTEARRRHEARHPPRSRRCGGRRGWRGAGTTRGTTPIRTGAAILPPSRELWESARARRAGRPARADGHGDRLLCPRRHARERAGGGADVPRRRSARAAVRRRDDRRAPSARRRSIPNLATFVAHGPSARPLPRLPVAGRARLRSSSASRSTATATG